jgi:hypothetical protein
LSDVGIQERALTTSDLPLATGASVNVVAQRTVALLRTMYAEMRETVADLRRREDDLKADRDAWRAAHSATQRLLPKPMPEDCHDSRQGAHQRWNESVCRSANRMGRNFSQVFNGCAPWNGGVFQWVQVPPGDRSSRKQPEQLRR